MDLEDGEGPTNGVRLHGAPFGQRALVIGQAILCLGVSQEPEHAQDCSGIRWSVVSRLLSDSDRRQGGWGASLTMVKAIDRDAADHIAAGGQADVQA